ncbi:heavy metal-associated domain-containing protein, partial [Herbiconiux sp.]|uniref:heavy metal-associated domain-containing protein n=1 Tax=Herbiconiux sp. TaxID=1871186 RepID=UPI0025C5DAAE
MPREPRSVAPPSPSPSTPLAPAPSPATAIATAPAPAPEVELVIGGMTCASCANRIERKLNRLPGVEASVNYATEKARIRSAPDATGALPDSAALIAVVESAGYRATAALRPAAAQSTRAHLPLTAPPQALAP